MSGTLPERVREAPWDARALGIPAYAITSLALEVEEWIKRTEGFYSQASRRATQEWCGRFYYCDTLLQPSCVCDRFKPHSDGRCSLTSEFDIRKVFLMARGFFTHDRFYKGMNMAQEVADDRYIRWLSDLRADGRLLAFFWEGKDLAGFWGYTSLGAIVLHALSTVFCGKGLAKSFWTAGCRHFFEQGLEALTSSVSASNLGVINLYTSLGFSMKSARRCLPSLLSCTEGKSLISFVVPFYKSGKTVEPFYEALSDLEERIPVERFDFLFIEDCGGDGSWEGLAELAARDPRVKAVQFSRNFGQHYVISAALELCSGDWAVVIDCDLQDRPEEIPRLYAKATEGYDDIVCARRGGRKDPLWKRWTSVVFAKTFSWLSGMKYDPEVANFRIISRKVIDAYCSMGEKLRFFGGHLEWLGFSAAYIDVEHGARYEGKSSYTLRKLINLAVDTLVAYSDKPLRLSIKKGFAMACFSFLYTLYLDYRKLVFDIPVEGWTSIMISAWFLGGLIIANLRIIGIYLGKVFDETKKRPLYVISKRINI